MKTPTPPPHPAAGGTDAGRTRDGTGAGRDGHVKAMPNRAPRAARASRPARATREAKAARAARVTRAARVAEAAREARVAMETRAAASAARVWPDARPQCRDTFLFAEGLHCAASMAHRNVVMIDGCVR